MNTNISNSLNATLPPSFFPEIIPPVSYRHAPSVTNAPSNTLPRKNNTQKKWTTEEDKKLAELIAINQPWKNISENLPGKSVDLCQRRWRTYLEPQKYNKSIQWTTEEDDILIALATNFIVENKEINWKQISDQIQSKTDYQCDYRWRDIKHKEQRKARKRVITEANPSEATPSKKRKLTSPQEVFKTPFSTTTTTNTVPTQSSFTESSTNIFNNTFNILLSEASTPDFFQFPSTPIPLNPSENENLYDYMLFDEHPTSTATPSTSHKSTQSSTTESSRNIFNNAFDNPLSEASTPDFFQFPSTPIPVNPSENENLNDYMLFDEYPTSTSTPTTSHKSTQSSSTERTSNIFNNTFNNPLSEATISEYYQSLFESPTFDPTEEENQYANMFSEVVTTSTTTTTTTSSSPTNTTTTTPVIATSIINNRNGESINGAFNEPTNNMSLQSKIFEQPTKDHLSKSPIIIEDELKFQLILTVNDLLNCNKKIDWEHIATKVGADSEVCRRTWQEHIEPKLRKECESKPSWTKEEEERLVCLTSEYLNWIQIADQFQSKTPTECRSYYIYRINSEARVPKKTKTPTSKETAVAEDRQNQLHSPINDKEMLQNKIDDILKKKRKNASAHQLKWTLEEDKKIIELVNKKLPWEKIAEYFPGKNWSDCRYRWQSYLEPILSEKSFDWTEEENEKLHELALPYATTQKKYDWKKISDEIKTKTPAQCSLRWNFVYKPKTQSKKRSVSEVEESKSQTILDVDWELRLIDIVNNRLNMKDKIVWNEIAKLLGKSSSKCRKHWYPISKIIENECMQIPTWPKNEEMKLMNLVSKYKNWIEIANQFEGKTATQCRLYYTHRLNVNAKNLPTSTSRKYKQGWTVYLEEILSGKSLVWTKEEDDKLKEFTIPFSEKQETIDWKIISDRIKTKSPKQCSMRWKQIQSI